MTTLRDFISTRESEIKAHIKVLRVELGELKVAKSALEPQGSIVVTDSANPATKTIKEMIRDVLKSSHQGLTSTEILFKINELFSKKIERTSLSPQLSRMKEDCEVTLHDNSWFLAVASQAISNDAVDQQITDNDIDSFGPSDEDWNFEEDDSEMPF